MKKTFLFLSLLALAFTGCKKDEADIFDFFGTWKLSDITSPLSDSRLIPQVTPNTTYTFLRKRYKYTENGQLKKEGTYTLTEQKNQVHNRTEYSISFDNDPTKYLIFFGDRNTLFIAEPLGGTGRIYTRVN